MNTGIVTAWKEVTKTRNPETFLLTTPNKRDLLTLFFFVEWQFDFESSQVGGVWVVFHWRIYAESG